MIASNCEKTQNPAYWIRLRQGKSKLAPQAQEMLEVIISHWMKQANNGRDTAHRHMMLGGSEQSRRLRDYWTSVQGFLKTVFSRLGQSFTTNEVEELYKLVAQLPTEASDDTGTAGGPVEGIPGEGVPCSVPVSSNGVHSGEGGGARDAEPAIRGSGRDGPKGIAGRKRGRKAAK